MANRAGSGAAGENGTAKPLAKPVIFISYSHKDEPDHPRDGEVKWRTFVTDYLQPAVKFGIVEIWVDQHLHGGDDLDPEIERKLHACDIFILLVSTHSMASNYIVDKEIAITRERQAKGEDVRFYPLLLTPTPKIALKTLEDKLIRPPGGKSLSSFPYDERSHDIDCRRGRRTRGTDRRKEKSVSCNSAANSFGKYRAKGRSQPQSGCAARPQPTPSSTGAWIS